MTTPAVAPAGYAIRRVDLSTASDDLMRQAVALEHALHAEVYAR